MTARHPDTKILHKRTALAGTNVPHTLVHVIGRLDKTGKGKGKDA